MVNGNITGILIVFGIFFLGQEAASSSVKNNTLSHQDQATHRMHQAFSYGNQSAAGKYNCYTTKAKCQWNCDHGHCERSSHSKCLDYECVHKPVPDRHKRAHSHKLGESFLTWWIVVVMVIIFVMSTAWVLARYAKKHRRGRQTEVMAGPVYPPTYPVEHHSVKTYVYPAPPPPVMPCQPESNDYSTPQQGFYSYNVYYT